MSVINRFLAGTAWLLCIVLMCSASHGIADDSQDVTAPPQGISSTTATLAQVLKEHVLAVGKRTAGLPDNSIEDSQYTWGSVSGTERTVSSGDDYRYDNTSGAFHYAYGVLKKQEWNQNENGQVVLEHDIHQGDEISSETLSKAEIRMTPYVRLLGEVSQPAAAYIIRVAPPGGRLEYVFIDKTTYLIIRKEYVRQGHRAVITYSDFRATSGVTSPWHEHGDDGINPWDSQTTALQIGTSIDPTAIAIPRSQTLFALAHSPEKLPAKIVDDVIVLQTAIAGKPVNFVLDSGAADILLNQDVADSLHLQSSGKYTGETAGTYTRHDAIASSLSIGDITMSNVHLSAAPYEDYLSDDTKVSGLMGFDFIANAVIHIDYQNGTVEAIDPNTFSAPAGSTSLRIALDDFQPIVSAMIGKTRANTFILDTGADRSSLFSQFVRDHPDDAHDQGLGEQMVASYPFVSFLYGVGGKITYRPIQVKPFGFAGHAFPEWLFDGIYDSPGFEAEDYDGLIGQDVLRNFDVYLDYPHLKIYFVPNNRFKQRWSL